MANGNGYQEKSKIYLAQAHHELAMDDLSQASEKAWGAAASMVKAVASQRRWGHRSHPSLFRVVERLAEETQDEELDKDFAVAGQLHTNFYEGWLGRRTVVRHVARVTQFVERMERLLDHG